MHRSSRFMQDARLSNPPSRPGRLGPPSRPARYKGLRARFARLALPRAFCTKPPVLLISLGVPQCPSPVHQPSPP
eukprot:882913-Pyramimonas_sp.AAC.1